MWEHLKKSEIYYIKCNCGFVTTFTREDIKKYYNYVRENVKYCKRKYCPNCGDPSIRVMFDGDIQIHNQFSERVFNYKKFIKEY